MMTRDQLQDLRQALGVSQASMANAMGMPRRTYEDIERGRAEFRGIHGRAAEMAALTLVLADPGKAAVLPHDLWAMVASLTKIGREQGLIREPQP